MVSYNSTSIKGSYSYCHAGTNLPQPSLTSKITVSSHIAKKKIVIKINIFLIVKFIYQAEHKNHGAAPMHHSKRGLKFMAVFQPISVCLWLNMKYSLRLLQMLQIWERGRPNLS